MLVMCGIFDDWLNVSLVVYKSKNLVNFYV